MQINDNAIASALMKLKEEENLTIPEDSEISHVFTDEFEGKMEDVFSSFDTKKASTHTVKKSFTKAAAIFLALLVGGFSLVMFNPSVKAGFKNAVMEFYETHIKFHFVSDSESIGEFDDVRTVYADYTVPGFKLKTAEAEYEAFRYKYENDEDGLSYDVYISENDGLLVITDKDKENVEQIQASGKDAYLISGENGSKPYSTLIVTGSKITVTIYGQLTRDEIIMVGNSLKIGKA